MKLLIESWQNWIVTESVYDKKFEGSFQRFSYGTGDDYTYNFEVPDKNGVMNYYELSIAYTEILSRYTIMLIRKIDKDGQPESDEEAFGLSGTMGLRGAMAVFSETISGLKHFFSQKDKQDFVTVTLGAEGASRIRFYDKIIDNLISSLPNLNLKLYKKKDGSTMRYFILNPEGFKKVAEEGIRGDGLAIIADFERRGFIDLAKDLEDIYNIVNPDEAKEEPPPKETFEPDSLLGLLFNR